jgi:hypothetical protein
MINEEKENSKMDDVFHKINRQLDRSYRAGYKKGYDDGFDKGKKECDCSDGWSINLDGVFWWIVLILALSGCFGKC